MAAALEVRVGSPVPARVLRRLAAGRGDHVYIWIISGGVQHAAFGPLRKLAIHTPARTATDLPGHCALSTHSELIAGSPLEQARKQCFISAMAAILAFPYMPRVADLPRDWRLFTTAQKIDHRIGLDRCRESYPSGSSLNSTRSASRFNS